MPRTIDLMHLGNDRVIAAHELDGGVVVDPGPASCVDALLAGLADEPRALLLTHIHLDHAGASGVLARRFPELRVYVHELGAPHLADTSKLLESAGRLYGDDLDRLWGEVAPVPAERTIALAGGESVEGLDVLYTPGHASHHVSYLDPGRGDAYVGDAAGVRIPPGGPTIAPTPPPDIDLEAWHRSLEEIAARRPERLRLTHFGAAAPAAEAIAAAQEAVFRAGERSASGDRARFEAALEDELAHEASPDEAVRTMQAAPMDQLWFGLERYWRKRREREPAPQSS
jgi:glyoxylase-like metal-dependent hydrolase (beta-lactamase superfamily II)